MAVTASPSGDRVAAELPPGVRKDDPNFGVMEVYHDAVTMKVSPAGAAALDVTWQGCAEAGLCYPPQTADDPGRRRVVGQRHHGHLPARRCSRRKPAPAACGAAFPAATAQITQWLGERSLGWTLPLFFLLGIALAFTPCVLPMLPIVSGIVVGSQAPPRRAFALSLAFVLPMAATYATLGVAAALAGCEPAGDAAEPLDDACAGRRLRGACARHVRRLHAAVAGVRCATRLDGASRGLRGGSLRRRGGHGRAVGTAGRPVHDRAAGRCAALHRPERQRGAGRAAAARRWAWAWACRW